MNQSNNEFRNQCYQLVKRVPAGKVTTYGEIARALNSKAYRAVGTAMSQNKQLYVIPCHRVVCHDGSIGEYALGTTKKIQLLQNEGVEINNEKVKDFNQRIYRFV